MKNTQTLKAPFPWFGGKSRVAPIVWERFGAVKNYVEPFFGSGAVLLGKPAEIDCIETVNDKDGFVANFWRAVEYDPDAVARHADWPVNENDLHSRHIWLVSQKAELQARLEGDPDYFDAKIAGWWCWGICCWIASGWCSGKGPWHNVDGKLVCAGSDGNAGRGVNRKLPHLGAGKGVNRKLPHLGDAGRGVKRKRPHLGAGRGVNRKRTDLVQYMRDLCDRLRDVRVCCGDWSRVCGPSPTFTHGLTGVFLDPPYADTAGRDGDLYTVEDLSVAHDVREWAIANGDNPLMRIALCGYEGEHVMPQDWDCYEWKSNGGYGSQSTKHDNPNAKRERIWFSPACVKQEQDLYLFGTTG